MAQTPQDVLRRYWGFESFRSCQQGVVEAVLSGQDNLVVMATGGGKSLCYQVPPLVLGKPAVVISPLISLMEDQVLALNAKGIAACFLGSAQLSSQVTQDAWQGRYQFIYMTPELAVNAVDRLHALQRSHGLALIAVDEAHCISEWGFDFRTEYRRLYTLREALPAVPFLALTATATPKVREDIAANLRLKPDARKWVMSFERPNLRFSVQRKQSRLADNFGPLLEAARRGEDEPTIVYVLTRREATELAEELGAQPGLRGRVAAYHGDMSIQQRRDVHAGFLHDRLALVVATIAFGQGIDKGNVRHVYHWGAPASLEAYYQQAGRAGRDGVQATCVLLWSAADAAKNAIIKSNDYQSAEAAAQRDSGSDAITAYIHAPGCRHRAMVEYFNPGAWKGERCRGGCDNCAAAAAGGGLQRNLGAEARLVLAAVQRLREMGLGTAVQLLRGSNSKKMKPWMLEATAGDGTRLHGAASRYGKSEAWWRALAGMLVGRGLIASHTKAPPGQRAFAAVSCTEQGAAFLRSQQALVLPLSGDMLEEERQALRAAEAAAAAAAAAAALEAQRNAAQAEEQRLFRALADVRKAAATTAGVAPSQLCSDFALWEMVRKRPDAVGGLAACQGVTELAMQRHGQAFVGAIVAFCAASELLDVGDPLRLQQSQAAASQAALRRSSGGGEGTGCSQAAACLGEPKGAAQEAYRRFQAQGQSIATIATTGRLAGGTGGTSARAAAYRPKPINPMTVVGYLADSVNSGLPLDWERVTAEAALAQEAAAPIAEAILEHGHGGLGAVKRALPTAEYSHIKLVAAMMNTQQCWFAPEAGENAPSNGGGSDPAPEAKRQRVSGAGGAACGAPPQQRHHQQCQPQQQALEPAAVLGWLASCGGATGPQLCERFGCRTPAAVQQLAAVLGGLVDGFDVMRQGGDSATCAAINLADPAVRFLTL